MSAPTPPARAGLLRALGVAFGVAVIVGNTIGVGILRTPGEVAARLPSEALFLSVWLAGGLYALLGALSLAELGAMIPRSGGQYVYVRRGLGDYPSFVVGWSDWVSTSGSVAAVSIVFAEYSPEGLRRYAGGQEGLALFIVALFTIILWQGIKVGDRVQQATSLLKACALVVLAGACLVLPAPSSAGEAPLPLAGGIPLVTAIVVSLQGIIYTYDGWTGIFYFGGEVKNPARDIPRATLGGVGAVIAVYLLLNVSFLRVVPIAQMAGDPFVAGSAALAVFGDAGDLVIRLVVAVGMLSAVNALLLIASRVPVAMAEDGLLPAAAADVSRRGAPRVSLLASAVVAAVFVMTGTFTDVLAVLAFFFVANYALSFASVFALRRREPDTPRPYRAWGYPWTTGVALAGSLAFLVAGFIGDTRNSTWSLVLLAVSYPIFRGARRGRRGLRLKP